MAAHCIEKTKTTQAPGVKKPKKQPVPAVNKNVKNLYREHSRALSRYEKKDKNRNISDIQDVTVYIRELSEHNFAADTDTRLSILAQELRARIRRLEELAYGESKKDPVLLLYQQEYLCEAVYFMRSLKNIIIDELNERAAKRRSRRISVQSKKGDTAS